MHDADQVMLWTCAQRSHLLTCFLGKAVAWVRSRADTPAGLLSGQALRVYAFKICRPRFS